MLRPVTALLVLLGLTAFAPAPLPRLRARSDSVSVEALQATYAVVRKESIKENSQKSLFDSGIKNIRIQGDNWTLFDVGGRQLGSYSITIDTNARPARIEWYNLGKPREGPPLWTGLVKREGEHLLVSYASGDTVSRDIDALPSGSYLYTLRKEGGK